MGIVIAEALSRESGTLDGPTHGGLTSSGVIVGSPGFMAPE
ncbi:hypothetical protein SBI_02529 [Streptomyces bingchenggensis BCW-1]|uniref:Uncharacterized protein n=1 Tax=Streptomyces bingchenggensis (strain BCW-1) TaxID=749414 RepID=D7BYU1_STRBB|nr:hypothetical protein SBI_02529 [Streptomyces bingchenggensis BCW-1]